LEFSSWEDSGMLIPDTLPDVVVEGKEEKEEEREEEFVE
jgi:hypothetical protein